MFFTKMYRFVVVSFFLVAVLSGCGQGGDSLLKEKDDDSIEILRQALTKLGFVITNEAKTEDGQTRFTMTLEQPVDHDDPDGPSFAQKLILTHRNAAASTGADAAPPMLALLPIARKK